MPHTCKHKHDTTGNQFDMLLGTLAFAKKWNRTLVLPPFLLYDNHLELGTQHVETVFNISFVLFMGSCTNQMFAADFS